MTPDAFHQAALALPAATFDVKWGADRVYSVGGKMFAAAGPVGDPAVLYSFKTTEATYELLIGQGVAKPAPYLARARWVQLTGVDALPDDDLTAYLGRAHAIVATGLTRKLRAELGLA
jgi:predicted DNA-binding protein (MmcQ/YjbR family)